MKVYDCSISITFKGDPRIKITQDCAEVTLDVYTQDYNALRELLDKPLKLVVDDGDIETEKAS